MRYKQIMMIYTFGFIGIILMSVFCVPNFVLVFHAGMILLMLTMMVALEWVMYGTGQRFFVDLFLFAGISIGVLLGLFENPHLEWIITKQSVVFIFVLTMIATYRALREK